MRPYLCSSEAVFSRASCQSVTVRITLFHRVRGQGDDKSDTGVTIIRPSLSAV